jgi:hypothetical protein
MTSTTIKTARITANHAQIDRLQAEKARIADGWLARGLAKTEEACEAISNQIISLDEEIDALEDSEVVGQKERTDNRFHVRSDEIGVSPAELVAVAHLGWGV